MTDLERQRLDIIEKFLEARLNYLRRASGLSPHEQNEFALLGEWATKLAEAHIEAMKHEQAEEEDD
jgi:hypothetical protein